MAKKIEVDLKQIYELAAKGYSVTMICSAIGISRTKAYDDKNIIDTIKKGADEARQKVINDLFARSESDQGATASIFLAKQLKVFEEYFQTSKPRNASEAVERIAIIYDLVAKNELNAEKADKLTGYLNNYIRAFEITQLEQRLIALENKL